MQSLKFPYTENRDNIIVADSPQESESKMTEQVVVTSIGSSIVNVNQQTSISHCSSLFVTERGDTPSLSNISNKHESSISKPNKSLCESNKHDHVTLLSVGDNSDTHIKDENS